MAAKSEQGWVTAVHLHLITWNHRKRWIKNRLVIICPLFKIPNTSEGFDVYFPRFQNLVTDCSLNFLFNLSQLIVLPSETRNILMPFSQSENRMYLGIYRRLEAKSARCWLFKQKLDRSNTVLLFEACTRPKLQNVFSCLALTAAAGTAVAFQMLCRIYTVQFNLQWPRLFTKFCFLSLWSIAFGEAELELRNYPAVVDWSS